MHEKLADESMESSEYASKDVKKIVEIGLICMQSPPSLRPSMSEIVVMLLSSGPVQPQPCSRPGLTPGNIFVSDTTTSNSTENANKSRATASITEFTGR